MNFINQIRLLALHPTNPYYASSYVDQVLQMFNKIFHCYHGWIYPLKVKNKKTSCLSYPFLMKLLIYVLMLIMTLTDFSFQLFTRKNGLTSFLSWIIYKLLKSFNNLHRSFYDKIPIIFPTMNPYHQFPPYACCICGNNLHFLCIYRDF